MCISYPTFYETYHLRDLPDHTALQQNIYNHQQGAAQNCLDKVLTPEDSRDIISEWKLIAAIIDRFFFIIFTVAVVIITAIYLHA